MGGFAGSMGAMVAGLALAAADPTARPGVEASGCCALTERETKTGTLMTTTERRLAFTPLLDGPVNVQKGRRPAELRPTTAPGDQELTSAAGAALRRLRAREAPS